MITFVRSFPLFLFISCESEISYWNHGYKRRTHARMLEHLPKVIRSFIYIFLLIFSINAVSLPQIHRLLVNSCEIVQGIKKHSNAISEDSMEKASHPEVSESRNNLEITKIAKELAAPCVPSHLDTPLQSIDEPGYRQREIYEDNGTFFRKLSATPIHPAGMFLAYLVPL